MLISAIAAMSRNRVIGKDNQIPWYLPGDLKFFKQTTTGHHIIMGRKNYQSIGKPLPKRTNVVVTRNPFFISSGCVIVHSIEEGIQQAFENGDTEAFIIGGGEIYAQALPLLDRMYLTVLDADIDGDVFFPEYDPAEWQVTSSEFHPAAGKDPYDYTIQILERRTR
ncbi:MAG: dihydrofolate reductase [Saprospiraceae bacterium]|nr:dihydrofolate reductase [Saprospiraceae bacterium]